MMSEIWKCKGFANAHTHLDKGMLVPEVVYVDAPASIRGGWTREKKLSLLKWIYMTALRRRFFR